MAPTADEDLLAWAREVRGHDQLQAEPSQLEEIRAFFASHEAESTRTATHTVLENYPDWWARGRRAPPGLEVEGREDVEELYRHMSTLFNLGIPATLAERRTPMFRLFQDVEAWGTREAAVSAEELIAPETIMTRLIGTVIGEVFPQAGAGGFLDAAVFDATGLSQTKGVRKTSLRLVWPGLVVDSERAARVRDLLVHRLAAAAAEGGPAAGLEALLKEHSPANAWHSVLGDACYAGRANVRMPLCDRVSPLPLRAPEHRPLAPVGVLRFAFGGGEGKMKVEWLCRKAELDGAEWLKIGCLRQPPETQLSDWAAPAFQGHQPAPQSAARPGRVKVRTAGGSDGGGGLRVRAQKAVPVPERAGQLLTVERRFSGAPDQFCEKMEQHLGKAFVEPSGAFVWRQPNGEARIVMYSDDKRVKVVGRPNQVRSLVVIVAPFTEAQPTLSTAGHPALQPEGRPPSDAFAPPAAAAAAGADEEEAEEDAEGPDAGAGGPAAAPGRQSLVGQMRMTRQDFEPQGQGELGLTQGAAVCVTHDPEGEHGGSQDRWVYGRSEASGAVGWFPLSHTLPLEESHN